MIKSMYIYVQRRVLDVLPPLCQSGLTIVADDVMQGTQGVMIRHLCRVTPA